MSFFAHAASFEQHDLFELWVAIQGSEHRFQQQLELLPARGDCGHGEQKNSQRRPAFIEQRLQQAFFAAEMLHQLRFAAARGAGDGHRAGVLVATFGEKLLGHLQHALPCWQMTCIRAHGK